MANTKVVTGKVRASFVHLFAPYSPDPKQEPAYSVMLLIDKSDKKTLAALNAARDEAEAAGRTKFGASWGKRGLAFVLRDGDDPSEADLSRTPELEGKMFMTVRSKQKPGLVDRDMNPIMDQSDLYSGCYIRAAVSAFPYNFNGNQGISFGLNHVQKLSDGEPLGGVTRVEDVFEKVDDDDNDDDLI